MFSNHDNALTNAKEARREQRLFKRYVGEVWRSARKLLWPGARLTERKIKTPETNSHYTYMESSEPS